MDASNQKTPMPSMTLSSARQVPPGLAGAGGGALGDVSGLGGASSLTSLGTIRPPPPSGTAGSAASRDVGALAGVWGGGSPVAFGPHAPSQVAPASRISPRPIDFILILEI
jgi:hypothetical protein